MLVTRGVRASSCCACLLGLAVLTGCDAEPGGGPSLRPERLREKVQDLYEAARNAGDDVPSDAYDWAKSDLQRIGDWEYQIVRLDGEDGEDGESDAALLEQLNELGSERWEVFWLERRGSQLQAFLKRPSRSYLRLLPLSDLGRLVPSGDSSAD